MALILPLLLTLMFAGLEGAHYLYVEHQVVKGVRDGARYAARLPFDSVVDSTSVKNVTRTGNIAGGTPRVSNWANADIDVNFGCASVSGLAGIYKTLNCPRIVTVSTTFNYASLFGALTGFDVGVRIHASQQAAVMGV